MKVAIIGGGAAGFFSAISAKQHHPDAEVTILEKSNKLLAKVKISGGGRCNVTNGCRNINQLAAAYPRGEMFLKKAFGTFNTRHTEKWFESRGVPLTTQDDNCVFPVSQDSQSIIDCLMNECKKLGVQIEINKSVTAIQPENDKIHLTFNTDETIVYDKVIVATGGSPKRSGLEWLEKLGHTIVEPVPSLFTFNMPTEKVKELMGIVVEKTKTNVQGTKLKSDGPLLITHWGMSGPSILKLSAFGARILSEREYKFNIQVNWVNEQNAEIVQQEVRSIVEEYGQKKLSNYRPFLLPDRLWQFLIEKTEFPADQLWGNIGKKGVNKIVEFLTNDVYAVSGKTTFKEEFVTCGGVSLEDIEVKSMQSKVVKNLYFTGEVMDIDGITGGYNFQAAWTTGFIAGKLIDN
jgi:predicted Rossmann fold flavoprotein